MDALEHLERLGHVEPANQAVLEAALQNVSDVIDHDLCYPVSGRRRPLALMSACAAGLTAAATVAFVMGFGHAVPASRSGGQPGPDARRSVSMPAVSAGTPRSNSKGSATIAAMLTAFSASGDDVLKVSKVVHGEGTCCKSVIWISPAGPRPGATVRSRITNRTLPGALLGQMELTYSAPAGTSRTSGANCDEIFGRPRMAATAATGVPGMATVVSYQSRTWAQGSVRVQAATLPTSDGLRACLRDGQWRVLQNAVLNGQRTIELVRGSGYEHLWIAAATYLPERLVGTTTTPYGTTTVAFAFDFLRPAAASLATLRLPIPAGFARTTIP